MASRGALLLPLLLVAFAVMAGGFMKSVNGDAASSFVGRRLTGHRVRGAGAVTDEPEGSCNWTCKGPLPTCCESPGNGYLPDLFYCVNTETDNFHCGACGTVCALGKVCCNGRCTNMLTDHRNCGACDNKCPGRDVCKGGMCNYAE